MTHPEAMILIDYIRKSNYKLNDWEKQFIPQVELHYRVSNKQAKCLEGIYAKSVGGGRYQGRR